MVLSHFLLHSLTLETTKISSEGLLEVITHRVHQMTPGEPDSQTEKGASGEWKERGECWRKKSNPTKVSALNHTALKIKTIIDLASRL